MSITENIAGNEVLTAKTLASNQELKWCPGCGDYAIIKQVQNILPELGIKRENIVFISGIGCSSRFPYYLNTYGMHTIHGRAPAVASGLKAMRPELSVWLVTGDGDALSIGGNHLIHILRRNININMLLFNNQIYGLTKGQYSPTTPAQQVTTSSPFGSLETPFNPLALAMGADASFIGRSIDKNPKHLQEMLKRGANHQGTSFLEIYQNCNIFNDGAFETFTSRDKMNYSLYLEDGQPLVFGKNKQKGIKLDGYKPKLVDLEAGEATLDELWIHDEKDFLKAQMLVRFFDDPNLEGSMPRPFGVFYIQNRPTYEELFHQQVKEAINSKGKGDLDDLLQGNTTWVIE